MKAHSRLVVLCARPIITSGRIELTLGTLGETGGANAVENYAAGSQFMVELPVGLTPVQQAADKLLGYAKQFLYEMPPMETEYSRELRALLDELEPPTLDEALAALRAVIASNQRSGMSSCAQEAALALLARVPS